MFLLFYIASIERQISIYTWNIVFIVEKIDITLFLSKR